MIKDFELGDIPDFASLIFVRVFAETINVNEEEKFKRIPRGFVFIINEKEYDKKAVWKLVGEHPKAGETPLDTAVRGVLGETHLTLPALSFTYWGKWLVERKGRKSHWRCLFSVDIHESDLPFMNSNHPENDGEVPKFFTMSDLLEVIKQDKFMREHYEKLVEKGLILPGPNVLSTAATA